MRRPTLAPPVGILKSGIALVLLAAAFLAPACNKATDRPPPRDAATWFPLEVGGRMIEVQLAVTPPEMQQGLMGRSSMEPGRGMIFVYERPQAMNFWMRNTLIPLDIGFFSPEGELLEVHHMLPRDESGTPSISRGLQFALEMNRGWFAENHVAPGARLDTAALARALSERGFTPQKYGLK